MTIEEIIETTQEFLSEEFEIDKSEITPENNLHTTLDLDSLDYVDLVVIIEENFGVKLTAEDFKDVQTFQQFYDFIYKVKN
ncbi:MAG: acyl carrier protein [Chitinophagales bacterium]